MNRRIPALLVILLFIPSVAAQAPLTVAEKSDFKATSRHADVVAFCEELAKTSKIVRLGELGTSHEGRKLPLMILADPPVSTPEEAAKTGKLVVFAMGNIHAGEVDGKEALLMLARDIATAKERPLLKDLILVIAPIFNADGNEKIDKANRTSQNGPVEGVGIRANAQGLDLNRDFVKLESPEVRSLVRFLNKWDPAVFIDCHTTNGSYHRYTLTYEGGRCPGGDAKMIAHVRDELLPEVSRRMEKATGYKSYFYGNFSQDRSRWDTVSPTPRYGTHYVGLRNRIAILSESYSYAPYKDRILASRAFVRTICELADESKDKIRKLLADARADEDKIILQHKSAPLGRPVTVPGFVEELKDGKRIVTDKPKDYEVLYWGATEAVVTVRRPFTYLLPAALASVVENLQRHGLDVEELREDIELDVEIYRIDKITKLRDFQKHQPVTLEARAREETRKLPAGTVLVRTGQPLGRLASYLLEPQSMDGLATWNFFDTVLKEGQDFPVIRLKAPTPLLSGKVRPLAEDRKQNQPISYEAVYGAKRPLSFGGNPTAVSAWLDDGEHFLQIKENRLYKVHALTGKAEPFFDPEVIEKALASLPAFTKEQAQTLARRPLPDFNPKRTEVLINHENDLYFVPLDGSKAVRLTKTPGKEELATFSPDGQFVAFVREHNLYVVELATQTERALTTDGAALISNGKADWVYFEEVFNRSWHAFWWSPDSRHIAFLRFDDRNVHKFTVVNDIIQRQQVEVTAYPLAGDPNPTVKLGLVSVAGGEVGWTDLSDYSETSSLVVRVGWLPDSKRAYFYAQDRAQTWLDFCTVGPRGGANTRLFREKTKAWVDDPGPPTFLKDGSFLLFSERTGWKHLYHFDKSGKLIRAVTDGDWEVRTLHVVDEKNGFIYFSGTKDGSLGQNLYRCKLDGQGLERLTKTNGDHRVRVSPTGSFFVDAWSDRATPTQVRLHRGDGTLARMLDTNPVYARDEYRFGKLEYVQIPMPDGFVLEGTILKPAHFDASKKYPVWFMTYAGPHAPTVADTWQGGRVGDEVKAHLGYIVFRCDPRSASGKGAASTWTAYRQLGVQELKDIEAAIAWLASKEPAVDKTRIGMSGHSYGGFMTAYAMTHSKLFAAGIAGAPVTDWRNYDSIYTERYMNTPQENPKGYDQTSVVKAAGNLHGKLLLLHGLMDDNVHPQNTIQLVEGLQKADKDFELMVYPQSRHGIFGKHYQRLTMDFMKRHLKPEGHGK